MARVLVNCPAHEAGLACLREAGFEPVLVPESDVAASLREAPTCAGVLANASLAYDDAFFRHAPAIRVVGRMGVGYDNVDLDAARRHGVRVCNTPGPVVEPVAEHTFALLLALARRILPGDRNARAGRFRASDDVPGAEIAGKTLGLIGLGRTGRRVAEIARLGFGMHVIYADAEMRSDAERALGARRVDLDELLRSSDVVSLHVNLSPTTRGLINARTLALMPRHAYLLNVSRGPVVDEDALVAALREGRIAGAGIDVYAVEPPAMDHPYWSLPNTVFTPHRAGFSEESVVGCSLVAKDIVRVLRGEEPEHGVV